MLGQTDKSRLFGTWSAWTSAKLQPHVERTKEMLDAVEKGLRECTELCSCDIVSLRSMLEETRNGSQKLKSAERFRERLQYQIARCQELRDAYLVQLKMREGVRSMAVAYVLSNGRSRDSALADAKAGYKECCESLVTMERLLESMLGTWHVAIKEVQGFARLCPGDQYEFVTRHGPQKFKSRVRIGKDGSQQWEGREMVVKCLLLQPLEIRCSEIKTLSKNVTLGVKMCETKDLLSAAPQLMTLAVNSAGSLKLNLVVTWNPLHGSREPRDEAMWYSVRSASLPASHSDDSLLGVSEGEEEELGGGGVVGGRGISRIESCPCSHTSSPEWADSGHADSPEWPEGDGSERGWVYGGGGADRRSWPNCGGRLQRPRYEDDDVESALEAFHFLDKEEELVSQFCSPDSKTKIPGIKRYFPTT